MTASICGPNSGDASFSRSSPMVVMLMVRGWRPAAGRGAAAPRLLAGKEPEVDSWTPPAGWRQAPTSAGRQAMLRTAMPPPRTRCTP
jgi:hypothetical protein